MKRVEQVMKERGIKQTALADESGISRPLINRVLRGKEKAWPKWRDAMATALDWPLDRADELFEEIEVG